MFFGLCVFIVVALLVLLILFFPVRLSLEYAFSAIEGKSVFKVSVFEKSVYRSGDKEKPKKEKEDKKSEGDKPKSNIDFSFSSFKRASENEKLKKSFIKTCKSLKRIADLKYAHISFDFGLSDAAATGIAAGVAYSVIYGIFAKLYYYFKIKKKNMQISVVPHFNNECMEVYLRLKFSVRIMFVALAVFDMLRLYKIAKKEMSKV